MSTNPTPAAMRAANQILDRMERRPVVSADEIASMIQEHVMSTFDCLVAGTVSKDPAKMRPSLDAGANALHTDIEAAEPFCESTGPMPTIRIQVEPVVAEVVKPKLPPVPDFYMALYTLTTESGVTFWTMGDGDKDLDSIRKRYSDRANLRILRIPGGAA